MSTEHQEYSTENQTDAIREYAERRGIEIVRTYTDEGRSGLHLDGRNALKQLLADVQGDSPGFSIVLVYDVSRWGRFQDTDEGAYYEYICKRSGIRVHYCAEQFENDGGPLSAILKGMKRAMAGEYSRELSVKVFAGQSRLIKYGFRQGGSAGYGLRRRLVDQSGTPKGDLARGEHKSIQTDRVILVPGPPEEVAIVQWIYRAFVYERKGQQEIVDILNSRGIVTDLGRPWTLPVVHNILTSHKYAGNNVWNRFSLRLGKSKTRNHPEAWIRADNSFEAIVDEGVFDAAQQILHERSRFVSDDELLERLKGLYAAHGYLTGRMIDASDQVPSSQLYQSRFGSLRRAYRLVGFVPDFDYSYVDSKQALRDMRAAIVRTAISEIERIGGSAEEDPDTNLLKVNQGLTVSIAIVRCIVRGVRPLHWSLHLDRKARPDVIIAVRLTRQNTAVLDYYRFPTREITATRLLLAERNDTLLEAHRFQTLRQLMQQLEAGPGNLR